MPCKSELCKNGLILSLFLIPLLAGCDSHDHVTDPIPGRDQAYVEDLEYPLGGNLSSVDARTTNGSIRVTGISGTQSIVHVHKEVRAETKGEAEEFAGLVQIHIERTGDDLRIYATHPPTWRRVTLEVAYDVHCERETNLTLFTVNGMITTLGTVAGVKATTTNGGIETALSPGFSGLVDARTVNGRVRCELPLSEIEVKTDRILNGRVGDGRNTPVTLKCVNGNIRVREF